MYAQKGVKECSLKFTITDTIDYYLYYPKNYDQNSVEKYGILLFLHGAGDIPKKGETFQIPRALDNNADFPYLILYPQHTEINKFWNTNAVMQLLNNVVAKNNVDKKRIYVSGLSRGAAAAWNLVVENPDTFAALAVVAGMAPVPYAHWINKKMPIWVFHGEKDKAIPVSQSDNMVKKLKTMGYNIKYTRFKHLGHQIWDKVYTNPELFIYADN